MPGTVQPDGREAEAWGESVRMSSEPAVHAIIATPAYTIVPMDVLTGVDGKNKKMIGRNNRSHQVPDSLERTG